MECNSHTYDSNDLAPREELIPVFLDSGLQIRFVPLKTAENSPRKSDGPGTYPAEAKKATEFWQLLPPQTQQLLEKLFAQQLDHLPLETITSYLKLRLGSKNWHLPNGNQLTIYGIWLFIETNTSDQQGNNLNKAYDRGIFYCQEQLHDSEKENIANQYKTQHFFDNGEQHYIHLRNTDKQDISVTITDPQTGQSQPLDLGKLTLQLGIRQPSGETQDTDIILDLGNTRTAALLFEHGSNFKTFSADEFKQRFKVLRAHPDAMSGEYDQVDENINAGIIPSWFVLHQLPHQQYKEQNEPKDYAQHELIKQYQDVKINKISEGWWFLKKERLEVTGKVRKLIPQMFMQLSPILIGDAAERVFNFPYAKALIKVGANIQQSSPKRYYWDDTPRDVYWHMMLNRWDKCYNEAPKATTFLPTLQGDMLRFIPENGSILDFTHELEPAETPSAYPATPKYPRQTTLTWFLLHLLERAFSQAPTTFSDGQDFIPHRLRHVVITYPSGWSCGEVENYRQRCQEALDIFSQANVYHGVHSDLRLKLVPAAQTPDEAVASQLPFIFSEINRLPNIQACDWIRLAGKMRSDRYSVRIMNFDIGGGTTDLSIVEYASSEQSAQAGVNELITSLLFKDGHNVAGDDLVKEIIENIILGKLISTFKKDNSKLAGQVHACMTQTTPSKAKEVLRSRITRTCLIPLAIYCLEKVGEGTVQFSAQEAGINKNNWDEFADYLGIDEKDLPFASQFFSFSSDDINRIISEKFSTIFNDSALYVASYDVDMVIFSGKTSELPHVRDMARFHLPLDEGRIIFAREFQPGDWYPFTNEHHFIADAKTVTVVGSALYYALSSGYIANWHITSTPDNVSAKRSEWGVLDVMKKNKDTILINATPTDDEKTVTLRPNTIIARRQNAYAMPVPVYKLTTSRPDKNNNYVKITFQREIEGNGESLTIKDIQADDASPQDYELKIWPCETAQGYISWQDNGIFNL